MKVIPILCASLLVALVGCKQSENANTTSSETTVSETTATTTAPATVANETMATNGATTATTGTIVTPGSSSPSGGPAGTTSKATGAKPTGSGPVVTETVSSTGAVGLPKHPTLPGEHKESKTPSRSTPPSTTTTPTTTTSPSTTTTGTSSSTTTTTEARPTSGSASNTASLAAAGQGIFRSQCTGCHGADASGNTPIGKKNNIPDFRSGAVQGQSDTELANVIANGKGPLSSSAHKSKHLSRDQINEVVAYIRSLK